MDANNLTKEYSNGEVTIVWQSSKCIHAAQCVKNNPAVFKPKEKPWIIPENSTTEAIVETVKKMSFGRINLLFKIITHEKDTCFWSFVK